MWRRVLSQSLFRASLPASTTTTAAAVVLLLVCCDADSTTPRRRPILLVCETTTTPPSRWLRKRTTLGHATATHGILTTTLEQLRRQKTNMMARWERDEEEESWRQLPARAWPPVQLAPSALPRLQAQYEACCRQRATTTNDEKRMRASRIGEGGRTEDAVDTTVDNVEDCRTFTFQTATTLLFYGVDPERGFQIFQRLADTEGHVDSMVACGIVLVEGLGDVPIDEQRGIAYLEQAAAQGSSQAYYELGTIYYVGIEGVAEEDEEKAFALFAQAVGAQDDHTAALYMMADCLATGTGTPQDIPRAVPLFYRAAERGHRFARQKIRELLSTTTTAADP